MYQLPTPTTKQDDSYMPHSDQGKRQWMATFIRGIELSNNYFGIPDEQFNSCKRAVEAYVKAFDAVAMRKNRTTVRTRHKNETRKKAVQECRALAMWLKCNPSVTNKDRVNLGLHVNDEILSRLNAPTTCPSLSVRGSEHGGHVIRFEQRNAPSSVTAKPKGVTHLLLFAAIGDGDLPPSEARLIAGVTKQPWKVDFPVNCGLDGKTITYYGRWIDRKGQMGPWSKGVSMILSRANAVMERVEFAHLFPGQPMKCASREAA